MGVFHFLGFDPSLLPNRSPLAQSLSSYSTGCLSGMFIIMITPTLFRGKENW